MSQPANGNPWQTPLNSVLLEPGPNPLLHASKIVSYANFGLPQLAFVFGSRLTFTYILKRSPNESYLCLHLIVWPSLRDTLNAHVTSTNRACAYAMSVSKQDVLVLLKP